MGKLRMMSKTSKRSNNEVETLLETLQSRFDKNMQRHKGVSWAKVKARLDAKPEKLRALQAMEATGGEPDVIGQLKGAFIFCDCSAESPAGRRSLCYDRRAWVARKENKPKGSADSLASEMGIELLTEEQYYQLQSLGEFDLKTSSWIKTPEDIRKLGGALSCDRRFNRVFTGHNGAESYFAARGFRGMLLV